MNFLSSFQCYIRHPIVSYPAACLGEAHTRDFAVVDVSDVDRSVGVDGRARDESIELRDEDDLTDSVCVY